ncbi:MAG: glycosyltransferase family 9 protein, partial [Planctomycetota bacterium]
PSIPMQRLQAADKWLGRLACIGLQPLRWFRGRQRRGEQPQRVLLVKFWGIGSLQLLTPAARCLRERHPGAQLTLLTLAPNAEFVRGLGAFDEVLTLDVATSSWPRVFRRILGLVRELRRQRFEAVYDFEFFTRFSAVITLLSGARERSGFAAPQVWRGGFHTRTIPFNRYWHVARNFRCLAGGENGLPVTPEEVVPFQVQPAHRAELDRVFAEVDLELESGTELIVLNPNAGSLSLERRWPPTHFAQLARRMVQGAGARVALVGAPSEQPWVAGIAAMTSDLPAGQVVNLAGKLSIGGLHALLERAGLFVSNDSGPMHLAAASGTPTVGLFGPETPMMYAPLGVRARSVYRPPACSPCINVHDNKVSACVRGRPECLTNLTVDHVLAEMRALVGDPSESGLRLIAGLAEAAQPPAQPTAQPEAGRQSAP